MSSGITPTNATPASPGPTSAPGSGGNTNTPLGEVFFITLVVTLVACIWILYLSFYNARVLGFLLTKVINKFIKQGHLHIGSFSFSVLSGKIMIHDVAYISEDNTIRAQHGLLIFRWWRPYAPLIGLQDTSQCETRLTVALSSCEVHFYNRTFLYAQLEEAFGLPPEMSPMRERDKASKNETAKKQNELRRRHEAAGISWRDFFGVIKFEITDGRFVFGNKLVPSVLMISLEDCHGHYTTTAPQCQWDKFTHEVKCRGEGLRAMLAPSPKYEGKVDAPPRYMGDGFVVMQSSEVDMHYLQDEPGCVPTLEELNECEDDEAPQPPVSKLDITCKKKGTHFTYGPWADRQREFLMKFFYPQEYKTHQPTARADAGEKRQFETLAITVNIVEEATMDILFTKNKETNAFHIDMKRGSYIEIFIPQLVGIEGFVSKVKGQLLFLEAATSLPYRSFIKSETLEFKIDMQYPRAWNHPQNWEVSLTFSKASWFFIYAHKVFLTDLMSDWTNRTRQDLFGFVPYTVRLNITLHQFELMLPINEHNWVDCSSHHKENVCIGLVGDQLDMSIVLPFTDFLPQTVPIRILIKADAVSGYLFLPDCYTGQNCFVALDKSTKASCSYGENKKSMGLDRNYWRQITDDPNWIECACVPVIALCILYTYHPTPLDEDVPKIVVKQGPRGKQHWSCIPPQTGLGGWKRGEIMVDPGALAADALNLELDIGPLLIMAYGPLIKVIPSLKEDFLGINQDLVDFMSPPGHHKDKDKEQSSKYADSRVLNPLALRPFNITVSLNIDGIKGFLPKYCSKADVGCATLVMEQLCFEMCREFTQTKLQLLLSPILLMVPSSPNKVDLPPANQPERGQMALSGLQLRCHAMFSRAGIPPDSETVEYAWLIDLQMGALSGQLTVPQLLAIVESFALNVPLIADPVDKLSKPARPQMCIHMVDSEHCGAREGGIYPSPCPSEDDLKYRVVRVAVNAVQLQLVEETAALEIKLHQIRLSTCNLHSDRVGSGLTALINHISIHQYLLHSQHPLAIGRIESFHHPPRSEPLQNWLEVGGINLGPVCIDCVGFLQEVADYQMQHFFLMTHDEKTKRLWFLWRPDDMDKVYPSSKCGCQGGCAFFSDKPYGTNFFKVNNGVHSERSSWNDEFQQRESDYGRSLLQEGKWVFSVCDRTPADSPTKAFKFTPGWVGLSSPASPGDAIWTKEEKDGGVMEQVAEVKEEPSQSGSSQQSSTRPILRRESQRSQQSHMSHQSESGASAVRTSVGSESTSNQRCDSSSTISSTQAHADVHLVGSSHSLPADSHHPQQHRPTPPPSRINSTESARGLNAGQFSNPTLDRTRARSIDSPTSGTESEYFSAGEERSMAAANQTSSSNTSIPSIVHPPTDSGSSTSEFKVQSTISSSDAQSPSDKLQSASSSDSFVSAASSEDTLIRMRDERDSGTVRREKTEHHSLYTPYLTRVTSHHWSVPLSLESWKQYVNFDPADTTPSSSLYQASIQMMGFVKQQQGVSPEIITAVDSDAMSSDSEGVSDQSSVRYAGDFRDSSLQDLQERLFAEPAHTSSSELEPSSGTSIFAEIQGPVNVLMTPLLLVAINRYVDAAKPMTTTEHPASLLSSLHHSCIADVESLYQRGLLPEGGSSSSLGRQAQPPAGSLGSHVTNLNTNNNTRAEDGEDGTKTVTVTVKLPKVNICVLQVPEDGMGISGISGIMSNNASLLIAQLGSSEANLWIKQLDKGIRMDSKTKSGKQVPQDTQTAVAMGAEQSDPTIVTLIKFCKLHAQLRRLARPGSKTLESPTAIPEQYTQVEFTLSSKVSTDGSADDSDSRQGSLRRRKRRLSVHMPRSWIMAESGMEDISIKLGRQGGDIALPKLKLPGESKKSEKRSGKKQSSKRGSGKKRTESTSSSREGSAKKKRERFSSSGSAFEKAVNDSDTKERGLDLCINISKFWSHLPTPPQPKKESFVQGPDTNLLTTASPALDEWLRAMTGLTTSANEIMDARHTRSCAIMACIMAEAHDNLENHQPLPKNKHIRWATISDAIQKDLSCQLMNILWRYLAAADWQKIEETVTGEDLPALSSLESGAFTLIRQWKVTLTLINPQVNVSRFPQQVAVYKSPEERGLLMEDEMWTPRQISEDPTSDIPLSAGHNTGDSEQMDPLTLSMYSDRIGVGLQKNIYNELSGRDRQYPSELLKDSSFGRQREISGDSAARYRSLTNTSSVTAGSISGTSGKKFRGGYQALNEDDKEEVFHQSSSACSEEVVEEPEKTRLFPTEEEEDEEEIMEEASGDGDLDIDIESGQRVETPEATAEKMSPVVTPTVTQFGDADTLFRPLLTNLGLHKKKSSQPLAKVIQNVGQVSFQFQLDQFKVVITKSSPKHQRKHSSHTDGNRIPRSADTPAFLCEKIHVRAMVRETIPSEKSESLFGTTTTNLFSGSTSIEICCDVHVGSVVQVINMAILRLLSQVIQMVENFQYAKTDLRLKQYVSSMPQGEGSIADLASQSTSRHRHPSSRSSRHKHPFYSPATVERLGRHRNSSQRSRNITFSREHDAGSLYSAAESIESHADSDSIPKCWQTMYHLINLYSGVTEPVNVPTTHVFVNPLFTVNRREGSGVGEGSPDMGLGMPQDRDMMTTVMEDLEYKESAGEEGGLARSSIEGLEVSLISTILVDEACLLAQLAGLHLEADTNYVTGSFSLQQTLPMQGYVPAALWRKFPSIGASLQTTAITLELSEKAKKDFYTIANLTIDKPQSTLSISGSLDRQNQASVALGVDSVNLTIPMNLALLSAVVLRSSKKLAQRILQLKQTQKSYKATQDESPIVAAPSKPSLNSRMDESWPPDQAEDSWTLNGVTRVKTVILNAAVLPQLQAQYTIDGTSGTISWSDEGAFAAEVSEHSFKFISTVPAAELGSPAKISFPGIHFKGRYGVYDAQNESGSTTTTSGGSRTGCVNTLEAVTEIQAFQHTLSPDLVNHLITVQKVILNELNNMVRGLRHTQWPMLSGSSKTKLPPTPAHEKLLYSMQVRLEGIQVTATSPTASAVRFETGVVELEFSNRPQQPTAGLEGEEELPPGHGMRMFAKALIEFNLSLGTLVKNPVFIEAEPDFHEMAYFKTKIGLRNTVKDTHTDTVGKDTLLISLNKPTLFLQSSAADRAVLLWLSYTSSYDQWVEQWKTMAQEGALPGAVTAIADPPDVPATWDQEGADSTLFLQLTVQDLGICIPILPTVQNLGVSNARTDMDCHSALVLTLESSLISACYRNSLVTKGSFHTICLRFTEDFQMAMDDWRPASYDTIMNCCVIPQGTYEVCSSANSNQDRRRVTIGQWKLNFKWRMEGIDVQCDPSIGNQLTALANTLTALTGADDDIADLTSVNEQQEGSSTDALSDQEVTPLKRPTTLKVSRHDEKRKSKAIIREINEQAKVVSDLRTLGAKSGTIAEEADKLRQMETAVFQDFKRDIKKKLKAQGMKVSGRDKPRRKTTKASGTTAPKAQHQRQAAYVRQATYPLSPYEPSDYQHGLFTDPASMKTPKAATSRPNLYPEPPSRVSFVLPLHTPSPTTPEPSPLTWATEARQSSLSRLAMGLGGAEPLSPLDLNATVGDPTRMQEELRQARKIRRRLTLHSTPMSRDLDGSDTEEEEEEEEEEEKIGHDDTDGSMYSTLHPMEGVTPSAALRHTSAGRDQGGVAASPARSAPPEPELQLHLEVSIFINSGKLTLHCHGPSPSGGPNDHLMPETKQDVRKPWNSTESSPSRKPQIRSQMSSASSTSNPGLKLKTGSLPPLLTTAPQGFALFNLPAVDVKVEYQSEQDSKLDQTLDAAGTSMQASPRQNQSVPVSPKQNQSSPADASGQGGVEKKASGSRRGILYCWARLLTPAEEIVITTSLLDFLEQALETIPTNIGMLLTSPSTENIDAANPSSNLEASANSLVSSSSLDYSTFPVDVVVYVCMDPSLVHLSCLPASKVECLLQLPCVEFALSSKGGVQMSSGLADTSANQSSNAEFQDARDDLSASKLLFGRSRSRHLSGEDGREESNKADLSLSAVLSNFSLVIFHPYGGGQFKRDSGKLVEEMLSNMSGAGSSSTLDDPSKLSAGNARKDALSLEVTFVRVNVSRKKQKLRPLMSSEQTLIAGEDGRRLGETPRADSSSLSSGTFSSHRAGATLNKFSIMCDVGTATFRYDMRRLTEVLAFPKAWYRKTIVQRLFFGEEEQEEEIMSSPDDDQVSSTIPSSDSSTDSEDSFTDLPPRRYQRKRASNTNQTPTSGSGGGGGTATPSPAGPSVSSTGTAGESNEGANTPPGGADAPPSGADSSPDGASASSVSKDKQKFPYNPPSPSLFSIYSQLPSPSSPALNQPPTSLVGSAPPPRSSPDLRRMVTEKRLSKEETMSQSSDPSGSEHSHSQATSEPCSSSGSLASGPSWKTVLLIAVNFTRLDTHMNMSNVMGSTLWSTEDLRCQSHLTIDSTGHQVFKITTGLKNSSLEAKGGVIGGLLEVSNLSCNSSQTKIPGREPHHDLNLFLNSIESRIDYMGSSSLLARLTGMEIACEDEWKFRANSDPKVKYHTVESVYAKTDINWDTMQLMICRSTTPDMLRIASRLEEFFTQQFASSRRMLSSWDPIATAASQLAAARKASISTAPIDDIDGKPMKGTKSPGADPAEEQPKAHRHWQSVFDFLIQTFHRAHKKEPRPEGMRLGGQVNLQGRQALLACFHGLNFRSSSWALFTLREPKLEFETEALQIPSTEHCGEDTLVLQDLLFSLGHNQTQREEGWLATILRVAKNDRAQFPFSGSILEAFQYVSSITTPEDFEQYFQYGDLPSQQKGTPKHEGDPIFALPKLQLEMKSKQMQKLKSAKPDTPTSPTPEVQVTFVTQFSDHINVTMDFELIMFLHDLVLAYINYKQKVMAPMKAAGYSQPTAQSQPTATTDKSSVSQKTLSSKHTSSSSSSSATTSSSVPTSQSTAASSSKTPPTQAVAASKEEGGEGAKKKEGVVESSLKADGRHFVCATWQLEPTIRLLSWGGKQIEPVGVDYILQKLGFRHARTTIPKWMQRGAMDPADKLLSLLAKRLLMIIMESEKAEAERRKEKSAVKSRTL